MTCTLCGLDSGTAAFCCAGCENVYAILLESGVVASGQNFRDTELFQQSLRLGLISKPAEQPRQFPRAPRRARRCTTSAGCGAPLAAG
jgi:P-type Cu2+ transporter